jgi:transposase-like protein
MPSFFGGASHRAPASVRRDGLTSKEVARQFGYSHGAFRVLRHDFRRGRLRDFFATTRPGPREQAKKSKARDQVLALCKPNYSIYGISRTLKEQGSC